MALDTCNEIDNLHQTITRLWKVKPSGLGINPSFCMLLAVFFGIMRDGLSKRGTTHSLVYWMYISGTVANYKMKQNIEQRLKY